MVVLNKVVIYFAFTCLVRALRAGLHDFPGAWRRCNFLQWNDHCASLRLALHPENRTLQPVQLRFLGLMPRILVSDTNIWIDFHRADLLNAVFRLPYTFCTTDFVKAELTTPGIDYMISLGLTIHSLDGNEIKQLYGLCQSFNNSALADVSCLFLANALNCPLLTGDGRLRKTAGQQGVIVYGSLWLLDRLFTLKIISGKEASEGLRAMMTKNGRLPKEACQKRLTAWDAAC
ncbi:MAG: hypothetical protein WC091_21985 [Sulfuricellaceae bacterium]